jgi:hypothetical protein
MFNGNVNFQVQTTLETFGYLECWYPCFILNYKLDENGEVETITKSKRFFFASLLALSI